MFFAEWNTMLFLCSPIINNVEGLQFAGLFINDLAMHDFSRDLLLTGRMFYKDDELFNKKSIITWCILQFELYKYDEIIFYFKGSQKANELKDALDAETEKTALMQEAMKKVDIEMKRSDELLSQMIPKAVAEKVKKGLNPVDTCEVSKELNLHP